uniref:Uncharacterized protein n=1 Tax=Glossina pallidipes TaxID=7398 RepID=A0A1A9Z294_GLOPL
MIITKEQYNNTSYVMKRLLQLHYYDVLIPMFVDQISLQAIFFFYLARIGVIVIFSIQTPIIVSGILYNGHLKTAYLLFINSTKMKEMLFGDSEYHPPERSTFSVTVLLQEPRSDIFH